MEANDLVVVYTTNNPIHAEIIRNALRSEGIHCELEGEYQGGLSWILDVKILTRAWDGDRAKKIIKRQETHHASQIDCSVK